MEKITLGELKKIVKKLVEQSIKDNEASVDESDKDHEDDPRWEKHADPTGKEWDHGLE